MSAKRLLGLLALAVVVAGAGLVTTAPPADAAIGIVRWWPTGSDPTQDIHYRLNFAATSGRVEIRSSASPAVVTKTITLQPADLTVGEHSVLWDGTANNNLSAPTGSYFARIVVSKAAVVAGDQYGAITRIRDHSVQEPTSGRYFGIDSDFNPANNNQDDPSKSTFGNIYLSNTATKRIEVWTPGIANGGDYAACVIGDPATTTAGWNSGWTSSSSPWGLAVSRSGRVFSSNRSLGRLGNWAWDGSGAVLPGESQQSGNTRDVDVLGLNPDIANGGDGVYEAAISSSYKAGAIQMQADWTYPADYAAFKVLVSNDWASDANSNGQGMCFEDRTALPWTTNWFFAIGVEGKVYGYSGNGSNWDGLTALSKNGIVLDVPSATDVAVVSKDSSGRKLVVSRAAANADPLYQLEVWNVPNSGSPARLGTMLIGSGATGTSKVTVDPWGNVLVCAGTYLPGPWAYIWELPDAGSTDTRDTKAFQHTYSNLPPVIESITVTKGATSADALPLDDATTTDITMVVRDPDGYNDLASTASIDLTPFGYSATTMTQISNDGDKKATYQITGVKAKASSRAGKVNLPISISDKAVPSVHTVAGNAAVYTVGGTLTGVITHKDGKFTIKGATVTATDGKNIYTGTSGDDGSYSLSVNPAAFTVTASKAGYGAGTASSVTVVPLGGSVAPNLDATLGSISISAARAVPFGTKVCVEAVVCAADYTGKSDTTWQWPKFYLRDASGSASNGLVTPTNNMGIRVYAGDTNKPVEGTKVVVEGVTDQQPFLDLRINGVTGYAEVSKNQAYPSPDTAVVDDFNDPMNNNPDVRWGDLVKAKNVTVATVDTTTNADWFEMTVTDSSSDTAGRVVVWKATGITDAQINGLLGKTIDITGIIARRHDAANYDGRVNCLEPRKYDDLFAGPAVVATTGAARALEDGQQVTITGTEVVSMALTSPQDGFWMQDQDGTAGIHVIPDTSMSTMPAQGDTIKNIVGRIGFDSATGEMRVTNATWTAAGTGGTIKIRTVGNKAVGGRGYNPAMLGVDTEGLIVKLFGKVTKYTMLTPEDQYPVLWLDDGAGRDAGNAGGELGIKVLDTLLYSEPSMEIGRYYSVTGAVSSVKVNGKKVPALRCRNQEYEVLAP